MADFYGCLLSTSFTVKDTAAFLADPDVETIKRHCEAENGFFEVDHGAGVWAFGWEGQYPGMVLNGTDDDGTETELDITDVIQRHITPGEACKIAVTGNEKLRYTGGLICFVTAKGTAYFDATVDWAERLTENDVDALGVAFKSMCETVQS